MRDFGVDINAHIADLQGVVPRHLLWVEAQNRDTGAVEAQGFWNGSVDRDFTIGGVTRNYVAAGSLLDIGPIKGGVGLNVQMHTIQLSNVPPEVKDAIELYSARLAPVEMHRVYFHPEKNVVIGDPVRILKGSIDQIENPRPAEGGSAPVVLKIASAVRGLTRTLTSKKSDEAQRRIDPIDRGREYATVSGAVDVFWGVKQSRGAPPPAATPAAQQERSSLGGGPGKYGK